MPAQLSIPLSEKEEAQLRSAVRSKISPPRLVMRARVVLLAAQGIPSYQVAEQWNVSKDTVGVWRRRYVEEGYSALLKDRTRGKNQGGKSTKEQEQLRQLIIKKTTSEKPEGQTHWSTRTLWAVHIHLSTVCGSKLGLNLI